jgi:hypothetical protein
MVISYIYSTCWRMKLTFYERQHRVSIVAPGPTLGEVVNPHVGPISFSRVAFLRFVPNGFEVVAHFHQRTRDNIYLVQVRWNV